ncbi:MAG: hypothetical protein ACI9N1_002926, partial [Flavobacteriales bacterium]
ATEEEKTSIQAYFSDKVVTHKDVINHFYALRGIDPEGIEA